MFFSRIFVDLVHRRRVERPCTRLGLDEVVDVPSGKRTLVIALGVLRQPPSAIVA